MSDFLNIAAKAFAEVCEHVGVRDFQCQIGVGGLLDELGALHGEEEARGAYERDSYGCGWGTGNLVGGSGRRFVAV